MLLLNLLTYKLINLDYIILLFVINRASLISLEKLDLHKLQEFFLKIVEVVALK